MIYIRVMILGIMFSVVPVSVGKLLVAGVQRSYTRSPLFCTIMGFMGMLAVFELITVPCTLAEIPFHILVYLFSLILALLTIYALIKYGRTIWEDFRDFLHAKRWLNIVFILALIVILVQMLISVISANYIGEDDAAYIVYSKDMIYYDSLFGYNPYTGEYTGIGVNKMTLTSWCAYVAYLSKISGIPVAIVAHTILPFVLIGYAYAVYYLMARVLMRENYTKIGGFLLVLSALHIGGDFSWYTITLRLLQCQWHGKAVVAIIIIPFLILYIYCMNTEETYRKEYINLILVTIAATGCTLVGGGLSLMVVFAGALVFSVVRRKLRILKNSLLCCIPCALFCVAFLMQYTLTAWLKG